MKIAAVVILYHPTEQAISNISTYYDHVDRLFVCDNTENTSPLKNTLIEWARVEWHHNFENSGIAIRLNQVCKMAIAQGHDWLLTMDQDSYFSKEELARYLDCFYQYQQKEKVAVFGIKYEGINEISNRNCTAVESLNLITSGMLVNLNVYKLTEGFDEALFIDSVDHDYIINAKIKGYSIIEFSNIYLCHQLGNTIYRSSIKSLFLIRKKKKIHSPLRIYYIYRNMLYLQEKYKRHGVLLEEIKKITKQHILHCFFYGRNSWQYIKYLFAAKRDFKNKKMGKIDKLL